MGRAVAALADAEGEFQLTGATTSAHHAKVGQRMTDHPAAPLLRAEPLQCLAGAQVAIDFSLASAVEANAAACAQRSVPLVLCVTGLGEREQAAVDAAAARIAVLQTANTSAGVAVMAWLTEAAAAALPGHFDAAVSEIHHRGKRDSPSGTAIMLTQAIERGWADGTPRSSPPSVQSVRAGGAVGTHTVLFAGMDETVEITHRAASRAAFARGALTAARWLIGKPAGTYSMRDVLAVAAR